MSAAELGWLMSVNRSLFMVVSMGCRARSSRAGHAVPGELHADLLLAEPHGCHPFPRKLSTACGGLLLDCPGCHVSALSCKRNGPRVLQPLQMLLSVALMFSFTHLVQTDGCVHVAYLYIKEQLAQVLMDMDLARSRKFTQ